MKKALSTPLGFCVILIFSSFLWAPFFTTPVVAVSASYSYDVEGCFLVLDPDLSADVDEYCWTIYPIGANSKGRTEWIDADDEREYKSAIEKTGEYVVALTARNGSDSHKYQRSIFIDKGMLSTQEQITTTGEVETVNIVEVLIAWIGGWFSLLSPLFRWAFLVFLAALGFIFAFIIYRYHDDQKYGFYQVIRKK